MSGTTTSVNTTNLEIQDALLELNKNNSGGADVDAGVGCGLMRMGAPHPLKQNGGAV